MVCHFDCFRFKSQLKRLAQQEPFWGARRLIEHVHQNVMNALMSRPPGAQFKVICCSVDKKYFSFHFQVPRKPGAEQVRRYLKQLGFVNRRVVKRPMLRQMHVKARMEFARKYGKWTVEQWKHVVFSDEKMFRTRPGVLTRCWRQKKMTASLSRSTSRAPCKSLWASWSGLPSTGRAA